jgi:hypothetical protein
MGGGVIVLGGRASFARQRFVLLRLVPGFLFLRIGRIWQIRRIQHFFFTDAAAAPPQRPRPQSKKKRSKWWRKRDDPNDARLLGTIYTQMSQEIGAADPLNPPNPQKNNSWNQPKQNNAIEIETGTRYRKSASATSPTIDKDFAEILSIVSDGL